MEDTLTALQAATWDGHEQMVRILLDRGASPNAPGPDGTALQIAVRQGHEQIVQMLLDKGAIDTRQDQEEQEGEWVDTSDSEEE